MLFYYFLSIYYLKDINRINFKRKYVMTAMQTRTLEDAATIAQLFDLPQVGSIQQLQSVGHTLNDEVVLIKALTSNSDKDDDQLINGDISLGVCNLDKLDEPFFISGVDFTYLEVAESLDEYSTKLKEAVTPIAESNEPTVTYHQLASKDSWQVTSHNEQCAALVSSEMTVDVESLVTYLKELNWDKVKTNAHYKGEPLTLAEFYGHRQTNAYALHGTTGAFVAYAPSNPACNSALGLALLPLEAEGKYKVILEMSAGRPLDGILALFVEEHGNNPIELFKILTQPKVEESK